MPEQNEREFAAWAAGRGAIAHSPETQSRIRDLDRKIGGGPEFYALLQALDRITNTGMRLVVHQTYAQNVYLDGRPLQSDDFKLDPQGHTGGALNMVPAYAGYLAANVLARHTRGWIMGQGHCVSAIDSLNLLVGNMTEAHAARYSVDDEGLTRFVRDFYSYRLDAEGEIDSPLGSHVNAHTAGGIAEGGYLGFVELEYVHMPLPGERLVVFLSDGAFEEQRGSDWAPRWWRSEDCGLITPIMIANGRRIDQRTTMSQQGGVDWFRDHLRLNHFDPLLFDGRDPAAFVWAIFEMEERLLAGAEQIRSGAASYPVLLPHGIAEAPKGAGFPGEGTNLAHNLPLLANPHTDADASRRFNEGAARLWVAPEELRSAIASFQSHGRDQRPHERDNLVANRQVNLDHVPSPMFRDVAKRALCSPMDAVDQMFVAAVESNPHLRPRVGNPDEMKSNRLTKTLDLLKFRVSAPEPGIPEAILGGVITALNEEAVASAALGNKGGINLVHTYEAFGMKMHGVARQEIIFSAHCINAGKPPGWLSVPLVLTSHTWENGKNEQSHQDPSLCEALLQELAPVSRVLFPADFNSAAVVMEHLYQTHGQIWTLVIPKAKVADRFEPDQARQLFREGGITVTGAAHEPEEAQLLLVAVGAYQLAEVLRASGRLREKKVPHRTVYLLEPGRFREARSEHEAVHVTAPGIVERLFPAQAGRRVFVSHTRPEPLIGALRPLFTEKTRHLGYVSSGGTLSTEGMLLRNRCSWAHCLRAAAELLDLDPGAFLTPRELDALDGRLNPLTLYNSPVQ